MCARVGGDAARLFGNVWATSNTFLFFPCEAIAAIARGGHVELGELICTFMLVYTLHAEGGETQSQPNDKIAAGKITEPCVSSDISFCILLRAGGSVDAMLQFFESPGKQVIVISNPHQLPNPQGYH